MEGIGKVFHDFSVTTTSLAILRATRSVLSAPKMPKQHCHHLKHILDYVGFDWEEIFSPFQSLIYQKSIDFGPGLIPPDLIRRLESTTSAVFGNTDVSSANEIKFAITLMMDKGKTPFQGPSTNGKLLFSTVDVRNVWDNLHPSPSIKCGKIVVYIMMMWTNFIQVLAQNGKFMF
ncbi:hypothetical protein AVEN_210360-1 [Araneus ventricosus]|uniref:Uncharacterized protein n=1 Tax=Araneus ventricosus TaxID=182803 RepID=A0A4Y2CTH0_ARAVE|nr:hypothetical protein AVEN_210360-1 [Araneus ventricosus]